MERGDTPGSRVTCSIRMCDSSGSCTYFNLTSSRSSKLQSCIYSVPVWKTQTVSSPGTINRVGGSDGMLVTLDGRGAVLRALLFLRRRGACSRDGARRYAQLPGIMFDSHINFFRALHIRSIPQPILNPARDLFNRFALYGNCQYGRGSVISRREVSWIKDRCFTRWRGFNDDAGAILRGSTVVGRSDDYNWPGPCIAHISQSACTSAGGRFMRSPRNLKFACAVSRLSCRSCSRFEKSMT